MPKSSPMRHMWLAALFIFMVATACGSPVEADDGPFTLGVLPDEAPERLIERYASLIERLELDLGRDVQLVIPADYADFVSRFETGAIDVGYFGGVTFVMARERAGAEPLVMRDVDARFTSVFVVRGDDPRSSMAEFAGSTLGFGSELSTSGHLMPRLHFERDFGTMPENHFEEVSFSGAHDRTLRWVIDGTVDIGALNSVIFRRLVSDGTIDPGAVRVLYETPIYVDYVFAGHPDLAPTTRAAVQDSLLGLSVMDDADRAILEDLRAGRFLHASTREWDDLEAVSREIGVLGDG